MTCCDKNILWAKPFKLFSPNPVFCEAMILPSVILLIAVLFKEVTLTLVRDYCIVREQMWRDIIYIHYKGKQKWLLWTLLSCTNIKLKMSCLVGWFCKQTDMEWKEKHNGNTATIYWGRRQVRNCVKICKWLAALSTASCSGKPI